MFYLGPVDSDDDDDSDAPVSGQLPDMSTVQREDVGGTGHRPQAIRTLARRL